MTQEALHLTRKLLGDLRANPDVPCHQACQAVLLGSAKVGLSNEDLREVLEAVRMEYGLGRTRFAEMMVLLLKSLPDELRWDVRRIITP